LSGWGRLFYLQRFAGGVDITNGPGRLATKFVPR